MFGPQICVELWNSKLAHDLGTQTILWAVGPQHGRCFRDASTILESHVGQPGLQGISSWNRWVRRKVRVLPTNLSLEQEPTHPVPEEQLLVLTQLWGTGSPWGQLNVVGIGQGGSACGSCRPCVKSFSHRMH